MHRRSLLSASLGATAALAGCVGSLVGDTVTESFDSQVDVTDETVVAVRNRNGPVTVESTDDDLLSLSGEKRASSEAALESITVDVTAGERLLVEVRFGSGSDFETRAVDLTVAVPSGVVVDGVRTDNGDIEAGGVAGDLDATTTNGDVQLHGVAGGVAAETTNGDVTVRDAAGLRRARTTNGDIDADLLSMAGDVTCRSTNGDVTVAVGEGIAAAVRLETDRGAASVGDVPHTVETSRPGFLRGRLRGGGEATLSLQSTNGDVALVAA